MRKFDPIDIFVGQRVRMARLMKNMSQEKLADALSLTFQQVQKYEKGSNRIAPSRLQVIADTLEQKVSWFFDEQPSKHKGADLVTQMLTIPGGVDLARAFVEIERNNDRHVVLDVARAIAHPKAASARRAA